MARIHKGDEVIVTAGRDKGRRGTVVKVISERDRLVVEGINMVKKHQKPNPQGGVPGGIIEKEMSIHVSNVLIFNPVSKKGDRIGMKTLKDGQKVRFFKSDGEVIDV